MFLGNARPYQSVTLQNHGDNVTAVSNTLSRMRKLVKEWKTHPRIIRLARQIVAGVPGKDFPGEAAAIQAWVRENIRYTRDVHGSETLQTPDITLNDGHGDCDDQAMLTAALLSAIGHPVRFRAIRAPGTNLLAHVLTETRIGRGWLPVETTEPWPFGEYPDIVDFRGSMVRHV